MATPYSVHPCLQRVAGACGRAAADPYDTSAASAAVSNASMYEAADAVIVGYGGGGGASLGAKDLLFP